MMSFLNWKKWFVCFMVVLLTVHLPQYLTTALPNNSSKCPEKIDLGFILDCSGSVSTNDFRKMKQFVNDLTDYFTISQDQTRISVMWFSDKSSIEIPFHKTFTKGQDIHSAVNAVPYYGGGTNTAAALTMAYKDMFSNKYGARESGAKKILIILTDGYSGGNILDPSKRLKDNGVIIFSVGIGSSINIQELQTMASFPTDQRVILLTNFNELRALAKNMSSDTCKATFYQVKCDQDSISVAFERSNLPQSVNVSRLFLGEGSCKANHNKTHVFVHTLLNDCGTQYHESDQQMFFSNTLISIRKKSSNAVITREQLFALRFTCAYDRMRTVGTFHFQPAKQWLTVTRSSAGNFTFSLDFFRDDSYYSSYSNNDYPVFKSLSDRIYAQYSVNTSNTDIIIRAVTCRATPTNKPYDVPKYEFISGGCDKDKTIRHHTYGLRQMHRFSIQAFRFLTEHRFVYFHCDLLLCNRNIRNSTCARSQYCSNRQRRDVSTVDDSDRMYQLSFGPIMHDTETHGDTPVTSQNEIITGSLIAIAIFALLLIAVLLLVLKRRHSTRNKQSSTPPDVLGIDNMATSKG